MSCHLDLVADPWGDLSQSHYEWGQHKTFIQKLFKLSKSFWAPPQLKSSSQWQNFRSTPTIKLSSHHLLKDEWMNAFGLASNPSPIIILCTLLLSVLSVHSFSPSVHLQAASVRRRAFMMKCPQLPAMNCHSEVMNSSKSHLTVRRIPFRHNDAMSLLPPPLTLNGNEI